MDDPVAAHARDRPDALALRVHGADLTYAELAEATDRAARGLRGVGVEEGDRVGVSTALGAEFAAALHALPRLGAALVPLSPRLDAGERARLLEIAALRLVVERALPAPSAGGRPTPRGELSPQAPHTLLFTSGTSGVPKAVELTLANHVASARASAANLGTRADDRWLCPLPLNHVGGLAILLRSALYGTAAIVHERFDTEAVRRSLEDGESTLVSLVSTQLRRLAAAGLRSGGALRAALLGGGPVPRELLAWATERGLPVLQTYGMTETASQVATLSAAEALRTERQGSAGRPLAGVELAVEPPTGEVLVRGPMVAQGALSADGWLHTGDRGALDRDGYLWIEGRLDDTIVSGGENVMATDVEAALVAHPAVAEAAVVGRPDPEWGEAVTAYVVLSADRGPAPSDGDLAAHCRSLLAPHKRPKSFHRVSDLPRTDSGKVARGRLRMAGEPAPARSDAPPGVG